MQKYRVTMTVTRSQDYTFDIVAENELEARSIVNTPYFWENKENLAVNDWDSAVDTEGHNITIEMVEPVAHRYVLRKCQYTDDCTNNEIVGQSESVSHLAAIWEAWQRNDPTYELYMVEDVNTTQFVAQFGGE